MREGSYRELGAGCRAGLCRRLGVAAARALELRKAIKRGKRRKGYWFDKKDAVYVADRQEERGLVEVLRVQKAREDGTRSGMGEKVGRKPSGTEKVTTARKNGGGGLWCALGQAEESILVGFQWADDLP